MDDAPHSQTTTIRGPNGEYEINFAVDGTMTVCARAINIKLVSIDVTLEPEDERIWRITRDISNS